MIKLDARKHLLHMIDQLLSGSWNVEEFRRNYYDFYLEDVPDDLLSDEDIDFFGSIQEKLDWVDESPDVESRDFGWLDYAQFMDWIKVREKERNKQDSA